jgi:hypothetical protein
MGKGWGVIRGDVTTMVGRKPPAKSAGLPVLEGLGGVWPQEAMYDKLRFTGPAYHGGGVVRLGAKHTRGLVEYENVVRLQGFAPRDRLPGGIQYPGKLEMAGNGNGSAQGPHSLAYEFGGLSAPAFIPDGTMLDAREGMLVLSPGSYRGWCAATRARAPGLAACAMALPIRLRARMPGVHVWVDVNFWVQILETSNRPFPHLILPRDDTPGNEGLSRYTSPEGALPMVCDTFQSITLEVRNVPTVAELNVSRPHPSNPLWKPHFQQASPMADVNSFDWVIPNTLFQVVPSGWQSSDAVVRVEAERKQILNNTQVVHEVKITFAPVCAHSGSSGLQMLCLQLVYALDDSANWCAGSQPCLPSNFGCRLENPNAPGRCFVTSVPSHCLYFTVNKTTAVPITRHSVTPPPQKTTSLATTTPPPRQPTITAEPLAAPSMPSLAEHVQHVLDLVATLPDPLKQIQRYACTHAHTAIRLGRLCLCPSPCSSALRPGSPQLGTFGTSNKGVVLCG